MHKLYLVEDDENLGISMKKFLQDEGHIVTWVKQIAACDYDAIKNSDLLILDWMLPDGQGIDVLNEIKSKNISTPVIMLTARTELIDKVVGLESGANDYMTKPFEPRELLARIRVQLRVKSLGNNDQSEDEIGKKITLGGLHIDPIKREVLYDDKNVDLTKMEFDFLTLLAEFPNRAFSRDEILNKVWGYDHFPTTRTVDTHVLQLRQKLNDTLIETVRGIGYRLRFYS